MNIWILVAIIIAVLILALVLTREGRRVIKNGAQNFAGICSVALEQTVRKDANKQKIMELLKEKGELSNADIRAALGVSARSVVRYLDELEHEGKVEQVGKIGRAVNYRVKT
jgi:predicted ArsR family transcriptional regulator